MAALLAQVGWGFGAAALRLLLACSPFLTALEVGLGACIGDADLAALAGTCPHLQRLELRFAPVSGAGKEPNMFFCPFIAVYPRHDDQQFKF